MEALLSGEQGWGNQCFVVRDGKGTGLEVC